MTNDILYQEHHSYLYGLRQLAPSSFCAFGTLTWRCPSRRYVSGEHGIQAEWLRSKDFDTLMLSARKAFRLHGRNLKWYRCLEYRGQPHYHFLLLKCGIEKIRPDKLAAFLQEQWNSRLQMGFSLVLPYDQTFGFAAVDYCLKKESNHHERYDMMSKPLMRFLEKQQAANDAESN